MNSTLFICPVCREPLLPQERCYRCQNGHTYDIARRGYVNLLSGKAGGQHGDNREMIEARRDFLNAGHYAPLADCVAKTAANILADGARILDAGCGECYYTERVASAIAAQGKSAETLGIDVSREALMIGARRVPSLALAVASVYALPFQDDTFDLVMSVFSPYAGEEFLRVLRAGGYLLMVIPQTRHLFGLKVALYEHPYENKPQDTALDGFTLISDTRIEYTLCLASRDEIAALFKMTPYYYRTSQADREKLAAMDTLETEIAFSVLLYQKQNGTCS